MAIYNDGILGGFSGKIGPVVGSRWRGKNVLRSLPRKSTVPPSNKQVAQRDRFAFAVHFLSPLSWLLTQTFTFFMGASGPYRAALSYHLKHAVVATPNGFEWKFSSVLISTGQLRGLQAPRLLVAAEPGLLLQWEDNSHQALAHPTDVLTVVLYVSQQHEFYYFEDAALRADGEAQLPIPEFLWNKPLVVWAFFRTALEATGEAHIATSDYLGNIVVVKPA
ncbi:MAG: hypothetical protein CMC08_09780 [Flavobacteriaceae bacterium]|nr:hypothetical protein [Flavobacteriaceae bacterium]